MRRLLRNLKLLSAIGFLLLIAILWFFGYIFGFATPEQRLTAMVVVMLIWVAGLLIGRLLATRAGTLVERMFRAQFDKAVMQATPEQRAEVALLRKQLLEAISTLKKSNLGRVRGSAALYELPWYMIIGHPAAGKSSAIQNSGLVFPLTDNGKNAIRGVGGTRNCDWFFTTDGVLLDTAGRYSTQREDRAEWLEFLRLLKTHRSRTPVNGILVAISLPELTQYRSEGFADYARQIRARVNEIDGAFARKVPVYLLFTKVDLLGGFTQFFEDMSDEQRQQVWGATLSHEQDRQFDAAAAVGKEFEALYLGLQTLGTDKLAGNRNNVERPALFAFPIEFNALRSAVSKFVEILFEDDPYHTQPLLRGFYFSSALQEGVPNIPAGARVSAKFDLTMHSAAAAKPGNSQNYFLRDLFRDVIFPDQYLVGRQIKGAWNRTRVAALLAGVLVFAAAAGLWGLSYYQNTQLISAADRDVALFDSPKLNDQLARLSYIQMHLETLNAYRTSHHPWQMGFGLYQGDALAARLQTLYEQEVARLVLDPVKQQLEMQLNLLASDPAVAAKASAVLHGEFSNEQHYDALKTYLMLHRKDKLEAPFLTEQLTRHWSAWAQQDSGANQADLVASMTEHIVEYFVAHFPEESTPGIDNDARIVADSRDYLNGAMRKLSAKERIYSDIMARAASSNASLNLNRMLENTDVDLIADSYSVPAAYTRAAWENYVGQAIAEASHGTLKDDDWVLESKNVNEQLSAADFEKNYAELLALYKAAYAREWTHFIAGLSITPFKGLSDTIQRVERLSDFKQSPLRRVFARIAYETAWDNPSLLKQAAPKEDAGIKAAIVNRLLSTENATANSAPDQLGELEEHFSLFARMTNEKGGNATIVPYLGALAKMKSRLEMINSSGDAGKSARALMKNTMESSGSELLDGMQIVDGQLLAGADTSMREVLKPILMRPFTSSFGVLLPLANGDLNQSWQRQVLPHWQALADKYPFADSGNEAQLADISKFFDAGGALNKFVEEALNGLLTRQGNVYVPRRFANYSVPFTNAFLVGLSRASDIEEKVFAAGGESHFELQPVPTPGFSEVTLEIDGQQLRYRNGPQLWSGFAWPGTQGGQGAKITVVSFAGVSSTAVTNPGRMGWMRMVSQAKQSTIVPGTTQLVWMVPSPDNSGGEKIPIKFNLRLVSGANPLAMINLRELNLPKKIVN